MAKKTNVYDDKSITMLKGAERVRSRPAVIFGSDGLEGCEHSVFEILSNAVDEASCTPAANTTTTRETMRSTNTRSDSTDSALPRRSTAPNL